MAWSFGDSFDLYTAQGDLIAGYWDGGSASVNFNAGRFPGSRALGGNNGALYLTKSSGINDAVHHLVVSFLSSNVSGSTSTLYLELFDGATAQCSIVFINNGNIILTSGGPTGTTLATFSGAFPSTNVWYAFEFEVVINNTTGSFTVRKNGNTVADFTATGLNTRGGTANNYANKLGVGNVTFTSQTQSFDDLFWQSGSSSGTWLGDMRCYTRMPASDVQKQFTPNSGTVNFSRVNEAQQDGLTSYVVDSNPGDADFYGVASIGVTPSTVLAVTTRAYMQKSDAGSRTGTVQLKSGGTTVAAPTLTLSSTAWAWAWRTDVTDPDTGSAWTASVVNSAQIGPKVVA